MIFAGGISENRGNWLQSWDPTLRENGVMVRVSTAIQEGHWGFNVLTWFCGIKNNIAKNLLLRLFLGKGWEVVTLLLCLACILHNSLMVYSNTTILQLWAMTVRLLLAKSIGRLVWNCFHVLRITVTCVYRVSIETVVGQNVNCLMNHNISNIGYNL